MGPKPSAEPVCGSWLTREFKRAIANSGMKRLILSEFPSLKRGGGFARGRGRIQRQIAKAFSMIDRPVLSTSELLPRTHSGLALAHTKVRRCHREDLRRACDQLAVRVGRGRTMGRPILWKLKPEFEVKWPK